MASLRAGGATPRVDDLDRTVHEVKEPLDHILRPRLPWRPAHLPAMTECGCDPQHIKTITREEHFARVKAYTRTRVAMMTCMTCLNTTERWASWEEDARQALEREIQWEGGNNYRKARGTRLLDELHAIVALIQAHPDEFERLLTVKIQRREWNERKAREPKKP